MRSAAQRRSASAVSVGIGLRDDDGADGLAEAGVGHAGAERRRHVRVGGEQRVDLGRRDLVAAARDDVLEAADDLDPAVGAHAGEVAGAEIAVGEGGRGESRIVEVAQHAEGRADAQLAGGAVGREPAVVGEDAEFDALRRPADRAGTLVALVRQQAKVARSRFGEPIEVVDAGSRQRRPHALAERRGKHLAAGQDRAQSGRLQTCADHGPQHRRHRGQDGGVAGERTRQGLGRELRHERQARAAVQGEQAHPDAEDEGELERHDHAVLAVQVQQAVEHRELAGEAIVADDHALGFAGAARGEDDQGRLAQQLALARRSGGDGVDAVTIDAQAGADGALQALRRAGRGVGMERHDHAAREPDAEHRREVGRAIGEDRQYRFGRRNLQRGQLMGNGPRLRQQFPRRHGSICTLDRGLRAGERPFEVIRQRSLHGVPFSKNPRPARAR